MTINADDAGTSELHMTMQGGQLPAEPYGDAPIEPVAGQEPPEGEPVPPTISVEDLVSLVETLTIERDGHLEARQRIQAEFENHRRRVANQHQEQVDRSAESLIGKLLPTLDAFEAAMAHGSDGVEPIFAGLIGVLEREGLERIQALDQPFDPNFHEAVLREDGDGVGETVVEVLRSGYLWKGRVVRAAMVKVRA